MHKVHMYEKLASYSGMHVYVCHTGASHTKSKLVHLCHYLAHSRQDHTSEADN